jgi:hypothetical protein
VIDRPPSLKQAMQHAQLLTAELGSWSLPRIAKTSASSRPMRSSHSWSCAGRPAYPPLQHAKRPRGLDAHPGGRQFPPLERRLVVELAAFVPSEARLLQFGLGRDAYQAHHMLNRVGLVEVEEDPNRHLGDGRASGYSKDSLPKLHRFQLLNEGFDQVTIPTTREAIERRLSAAQALR